MEEGREMARRFLSRITGGVITPELDTEIFHRLPYATYGLSKRFNLTSLNTYYHVVVALFFYLFQGCKTDTRTNAHCCGEEKKESLRLQKWKSNSFPVLLHTVYTVRYNRM